MAHAMSQRNPITACFLFFSPFLRFTFLIFQPSDDDDDDDDDGDVNSPKSNNECVITQTLPANKTIIIQDISFDLLGN